MKFKGNDLLETVIHCALINGLTIELSVMIFFFFFGFNDGYSALYRVVK